MGLEPMTTTGYGYGYGSMRATDADRESVRSVLQSAYADGRLTWEEFDTRSSDLLTAKTYDDLGALVTDLRPPGRTGVGNRPTNSLAIISFAMGFGQFIVPIIGGIAAIVCGHLGRRQIRETGESGDGLALTGMIMGYAGVLLPLLVVLLFVAFVVSAFR